MLLLGAMFRPRKRASATAPARTRPFLESLEERALLTTFVPVTFSDVPVLPALQTINDTFTFSAAPSTAVAVADNGDFVVAWSTRATNNAGAFEVRARLFNADGSAKAGSFVVSAQPVEAPDFQSLPLSAAMDADGDFVIAYGGGNNRVVSGNNPDTAFQDTQVGGPSLAAVGVINPDVHFQAFDRSGNRVGNLVTIDLGIEGNLSVAMDDPGNILIAYVSNVNGLASLRADYYALGGGNYARTDSEVIGQAPPGSTTGLSYGGPSADGAGPGKFVVGYTLRVFSFSTSNFTQTVSSRVIPYDGTTGALGTPVLLGQTTNVNAGFGPTAAAVQDNGAFAAAASFFVSNPQTSTFTQGVVARQFTSTGSAAGSPINFNAPNSASLGDPLLGVDGLGNFTVVYPLNLGEGGVVLFATDISAQGFQGTPAQVDNNDLGSGSSSGSWLFDVGVGDNGGAVAAYVAGGVGTTTANFSIRGLARQASTVPSVETTVPPRTSTPNPPPRTSTPPVSTPPPTTTTTTTFDPNTQVAIALLQGMGAGFALTPTTIAFGVDNDTEVLGPLPVGQDFRLPPPPLPGGGGGDFRGEITGKLFDDLNGDGTSADRKPGLPHRMVYIDRNDNGVFDDGEPFTWSNEYGEYTLSGLNPGLYRIHQVVPRQDTQSLPARNAGYEVNVTRTLGLYPDRNFGVVTTNPTKPAAADRVVPPPQPEED